MSNQIELGGEVESAVNQMSNYEAELVGLAADGDATRVTLEVRAKDDNAPAKDNDAQAKDDDEESQDGGTTKGFSETTDDFDTSDALARIQQAKAGDAPAKADEETAGGDRCGAECADGTPCEFTPAAKCPHHNGASEPAAAKDDDEESGDDSPSTPLGYALANGPCVAAKGKDTDAPCEYGANDGGHLCAIHGRMDEPALSETALEAREAWEDGDTEPVEAIHA